MTMRMLMRSSIRSEFRIKYNRPGHNAQEGQYKNDGVYNLCNISPSRPSLIFLLLYEYEYEKSKVNQRHIGAKHQTMENDQNIQF